MNSRSTTLIFNNALIKGWSAFNVFRSTKSKLDISYTLLSFTTIPYFFIGKTTLGSNPFESRTILL